MATELMIVKRSDVYVVQIRRKRFFTRRLYWQDMSEYLRERAANYIPIPTTEFDTYKHADIFCTKYILEKRNVNDIVIQTYNTGLNDIVYPDLSKKEPNGTIIVKACSSGYYVAPDSVEDFCGTDVLHALNACKIQNKRENKN